jgi:hypothetical protein
VLIAVGLTPLRHWASYSVWTAPAAPLPSAAALASPAPAPRGKRGRRKGPGFSPA